MCRYLLILSLIGPYFCFSQNIIPNPSFEEVYASPKTLARSGQQFTESVKYWFAPNEASTDLITPKFQADIIHLIPPKKGDNMAGVLCNSNHWTEYLAVELQEPLLPGKSYYFECWMAIPDGYKDIPPGQNIALNEYFGLYAGGSIYAHATTPLNYVPKLKADSSFVLVPNTWQKFKGVFKVQKESKFLYFGQFHDPAINSPYTKGYFFVDELWLEAFEDINGAYEPPKVAQEGLNSIYFETDKYDILPQTEHALQNVVSFLQSNPDLNIKIVGHTDDRGEFYHNMELSLNRALAVSTYLAQNGVDDSRLQTDGHGDTKPIADNMSAEGRQRNRRVEFLVENDSTNTSITRIEKTAVERMYAGYRPETNHLQGLNIASMLHKDWVMAQQYHVIAENPKSFFKNQTILLTYLGTQASIYPLLIELIQDIDNQSTIIYGAFPFETNSFNKAATIDGHFYNKPLDMSTVTLLHWLKAKEVRLSDISTPDWKSKKLERILEAKPPWKKASADAKSWATLLELIKHQPNTSGLQIILNPIAQPQDVLEWSKVLAHLQAPNTVQWIVHETKTLEHLFRYPTSTPVVLSAPGSQFKLKEHSKISTLPVHPFMVPETHFSIKSLAAVPKSRFKKYQINLDKYGLPTGDMYIFLQNADPAIEFPIFYEALPPEKTDFQLILPKGKLKLIIVTAEKRLERNL